MPVAQTIFGQTDAVALVLVDALNEATAGTFCLPIKARRRFSREMDVGEIPKIGEPVDIQVFPGDEMSDRVGLSGVYDDTYGAHVVIQQNVGIESEKQCPKLMQLRSQIAEFLMSKRLSTTNAVHDFSGAYVVAVRHGEEGVYWLDRLESLNAFYSDLIVTYKASGLRRQ